jgi:peptidoglycan hydrolase-like protein with peptidoglycan-binding domain
VIRERLTRRRLLAVLGLVAFVAIGVVVAADPFSTPAGAAATGNSASTSLATVTRQSLSAQTQVNATLGYASASSIVMPAGAAAAAVLQAQQSAAQADAALQTAQAGLATDSLALERAQATLRADRAKQATDCRGAGAAESGSGSANASAGACVTDHQTAATDEQSAIAAAEKVAADQRAVSAATGAVSVPATSLAAARSAATFYDATSTYTTLPAVGDFVRRGQALFAVDGKPVLLLYGSVTAWRAFVAGMSPGPDVAELNANLRALGYGDVTGDTFSSATQSAIASLQRAHGLAPTGQLLLGAVIFKPGPVRVTSVQPTLGAAVQPGVVLAVSSTARVVTIALDAAQQAAIKVGDRATITLPNSETTPGVVSEVGTVATAPSDQNGQSQTPTVEVDITPTNPAATGRLDQAPVQVSITTASVKNALVVPVNALLALAGGGYAVETVDAAGVHKLIAVGLGLFDDTQGLVEVTDTALVAGQHVVVPAS